MNLDNLPPQLQPVMQAIATALHRREPAIRARVERLRLEHPTATPDQLAQLLVRDSRRRIAASGAASGAAAIAPGLGTLIALGTVTGQSLYALEQQTELVMAIAAVYGHELSGSDERLLEALVVVGIAGGAVQLRENVLVAGGKKLAVQALRRSPAEVAARSGGHLIARILGRAVGVRAAGAVARMAPLALGMLIGAGFDWVSVTALGKAAVRYYGPGGPAARFPALPAPEDRGHIESGS